MNKLRDIFNIFKTNGFDYIHEIIIRLLKQIITRKFNTNFSEISKNKKKIIGIKNISSEEKIRSNKNKVNLSTEENEMDPLYSLSNEEFAELNLIFLNALQFMKNKIVLINDFLKHPKLIINYITNLNFMFDSLLIVIGKKPKKVAIMQNFKLLENFLNLVLILNEAKFFFEMEKYFSRSDPVLINNKVLILKMFHNVFKLTKISKDVIPSSTVKTFFRNFKFIFLIK